MTGAQNDQWKDKYLRSLDKLEQKEKAWAEAEDLLRRSLGRLAHTGYGMDRGLDRQLDRVRDGIRAQRDPATLERLVRETSETAAKVQEQTQKSSVATAQTLSAAIDGLALDKARLKKAQRLKKQLEAADSLARLQPLLDDFSSLLLTAGPAPAPTPLPPSPPAGPQPVETEHRRPGLLGRLMGSGRNETRASDPPVPQTASVTPPPQGARAVEQLLEQLETTDSWSERLTELRHRAATCHDESDYLDLIQHAAAVLSEVMQVAEAAGPQARTLVETLPSASEALLGLMEKIEIPAHLQERLGVVKNGVARAATAQQVQLAVQSIADLMGAVRHDILDQKKELERFIEGVTSRVQILSQHVADLGSNRDQSRESRDLFHRDFQIHMDGIRAQIRDEDDIEALKQAIEQSLDAIEVSMNDYVDNEERLAREAEEQIADLSSRLHDMKNEAFLLQKKMQEQRDIALKDPLTGVFNRLAFEERIEEEFQRWNRYGNPLSLLVLDIDHFKQVNDTFGHLAGDKALKAVALRLLQNVREVDIVARYGGEEFVVIMPNTDSEAAYRVAEKLRSVIAGAGFHYRNQPVRITVSCGLAGFREGDTAEDAFRRADDALYGAKQAGRNRTHREDEAAADGP
jgi:diguanylate cyclase